MDPRVDVVDLVAGEAREVQVVAVYCCKVRSSNQSHAPVISADKDQAVVPTSHGRLESAIWSVGG